ncbi:MAG: hypothetical protein JJT94_02040 [Bernardetiaceae bacterium]|nr:hypothetical protein [Bernardetiaceae bacterium]
MAKSKKQEKRASKMRKKREKVCKKIDKVASYEFEYFTMRVTDLLENVPREVIMHEQVTDRLHFLNLCRVIFEREKLDYLLNMPESEEKKRERDNFLRLIQRVRREVTEIEDKVLENLKNAY